MTSTATDRLSGLVASLAIKAPCKVASTANLTLSGEQTIDGVAVVDGDRVLVKNQTTTSENGIYVVAATAWSRAKDFNGPFDIRKGTRVFITDGTTNARKEYRVSASDPLTIGTSSLTFDLFTSDASGAAEAARDAAIVAQAAAEASEDAAAVSASEAAASAGDAAASAASAAAVSGAYVGLTRTAIKALNTSAVQIAYCNEAGREGTFKWTTGDYATRVTNDTEEGVYLASDGTATTSGAWVRVYDKVVNATWFGFAVANARADNTTALQAALDFLYDNAYISTYRRQGVLEIPSGRYEVGQLTVQDGYSMIIRGHGQGATRLIFDGTASGAAVTMNKWIDFSVEDMEVAVSGASSTASARTLNGFEWNGTGGGTNARFKNIRYFGFHTVHLINAAVNCDNYREEDVLYEDNYRGWDTTISTQALAIISEKSQLLRFSDCYLRTGGSGQVKIADATFIGNAKLIKIARGTSSGAATNFLAKNVKMEWYRGQVPTAEPGWVEVEAGAANPSLSGELHFQECVLSGNSGASTESALNAVLTMKLAGRLGVVWEGGWYEGGIEYERNTFFTRTYVENRGGARVDFLRARRACAPANITETGGYLSTGVGRPVFNYRGCLNVPDFTYGASHGSTQVEVGTVVYKGSSGNTRLVTNSTPVDFTLSFGKPVILERARAILLEGEDGTGAAIVNAGGTKTFEIFSDSGYSVLVATANTASNTTGTVVELSVASTGVYFADGILYCRTTNSLSTPIYGAWLIEARGVT